MPDDQYENGDRFEIEEPEHDREKSGMSGCLKGCLIAGAILLVLAILLGIWVTRNMKGLVADLGSFVVEAVIDESDLPDEEKKEIKEQVARVATAFREGDISADQLGEVMEQIMKSPLMPSIVVAGIERKYFDSSGLTEEEKEAGRTALNRFVTGMIQEKIGESDFKTAMSKIAVEQPNGQWEMRDSVSDEELRELIKFLTEKADAAEVPAEVEQVDPSDEMKRIIDSALEGAPQVDEQAPQEEDAEQEIAL